MLNVVMLGVVMLSVVAPFFDPFLPRQSGLSFGLYKVEKNLFLTR